MFIGRLMSVLGYFMLGLIITLPLALADNWLEDTLHVDTRMLYSFLVVLAIGFVIIHYYIGGKDNGHS